MSELTAVPLEEIHPRQIEALLEEEIAGYASTYLWDFRPTSGLIRRLVSIHNLSGIALLDQDRVAGYSYFVVEDRKALIGNLFVGEQWSSEATERQLIESTVQRLRRHQPLRRIEAQPMMLRYTYSGPQIQRYERLFLELDLSRTRWVAPSHSLGPLRLEPWNWRHEDQTAILIYRTYSRHIDAAINDQYQSAAMTRQYLANLLRFPSCGDFCPECSFLLRHLSSGEVLGASLASRCQLASQQVGHISQICLAPEHRGLGLGRLLLEASIARFCEVGCHTATLTVTAANAGPLALYQSLGFAERTRLMAYVWPAT